MITLHLFHFCNKILDCNYNLSFLQLTFPFPKATRKTFSNSTSLSVSLHLSTTKEMLLFIQTNKDQLHHPQAKHQW